MGKSTRCSPHKAHNMTPTAPGHFISTNQANIIASQGMPREKAQTFKPELHASLGSTFSGSSTYFNDFPRSPTKSPTRASRPRDNFQSGPAVPGAFETTNMTVNGAIEHAHATHSVHRPGPVLKPDHGPLNAPTTGIDTSRSTYNSEFYQKPQTRGLSPNRRFVASPVVTSPDGRDFATTNSIAFRWQ